jgi:hypothetical protein
MGKKTFQNYLKEAKDPRTPQKRLEALYKVPQIQNTTVERHVVITAIRCAVARNPSTPPDTLFRLATTGYLKDVLANPCKPLLAWEDPQRWFFWVQGVRDTMSESAGREAWELRPKKKKGESVISESSLRSMLDLTRKLFAVVVHYRIPMSCVVVRSVPIIKSTNRHRDYGTTTIATWRGYSIKPLSVERVNFWRLASIEDVSGRINLLSGDTNLIGPRILRMLRAEGYTNESPTLKRVGAGLQLRESSKMGLTRARPTVFVRSVEGITPDPNLFANFVEWYDV